MTSADGTQIMDEFKQRDLVEMLDGIILYDVTWILWMNRLDRLGLDGFWTFLFGLVALGWLSAWFGLGWPGHPPLFCEETTVFFSSVILRRGMWRSDQAVHLPVMFHEADSMGRSGGFLVAFSYRPADLQTMFEWCYKL